ncbi:Fic family protein [Mesorhizobium shonense]|uniref:Fic family protein n=1 Tax=Mesorhizobium shonense TaxID=1209948 RepID=A0ABV2HMH5_9HYPH
MSAIGVSSTSAKKKVVARMFRKGIASFKGSLSAENYIAITQASRATATRDL